MSDPLVSVLLCVYNGERYIKDAIKSIYGQTFQDYEIIVVNDGSTDRTSDILDSLDSVKLKVFWQENQGLTRSLNKAISLAKGKYLARQDADDISLPDRLRSQVNALENNPEAAVCAVGAEFIDEKSESLMFKKPVLRILSSGEGKEFQGFTHGSLMFRRDVLTEMGGYYEGIMYSQDYFLLSNVLRKYSAEMIPDIHYKFRINRSSLTLTKRRQQRRCHDAISRHFRLAGKCNDPMPPSIKTGHMNLRDIKFVDTDTLAVLSPDSYYDYVCGCYLYSSGQYNKAARRLKSVIKRNPWFLRALFMMTKVKLKSLNTG